MTTFNPIVRKYSSFKTIQTWSWPVLAMRKSIGAPGVGVDMRTSTSSVYRPALYGVSQVTVSTWAVRATVYPLSATVYPLCATVYLDDEGDDRGVGVGHDRQRVDGHGRHHRGPRHGERPGRRLLRRRVPPGRSRRSNNATYL